MAEGKSAREAYVLAGYRDNRHNAARLKANEAVAARLFELQQAAAEGCQITIQSICAELDQAIAIAKNKNQAQPLVNAAALRAKLAGLGVERQEIQITEIDPFAEAQNTAEVLSKIEEGWGTHIAAKFAEVFGLPYDPDQSAPEQARPATADPRLIEWTPPKKSNRQI